MPQYKYLGPGNHYLNGGDDEIEPGEVVELPESTVSGFGGRFEEVDGAETDSEGEDDVSPGEEGEVDESGEEPAQNGSEDGVADPPLNPDEFTNSELESELSEGDFTEGELDAIEAAERSAGERAGALEAIENARE